MSKIKMRKNGGPIWRESDTLESGTSLLVALEPKAIIVRLKGRRHILRVPFSWVYLKACEIEAAQTAPKRKRQVKRNLTCGI